MSRTLYLANLSHQVNEAELLRLFADYGAQRVEVFDRLATAAPSAGGLVRVDTDEHGEQAIAALNDKDFRGHRMGVGWASRGDDDKADTPRITSMNVPERAAGPSVPEPRGPRRGDFGDRSGRRP